MSKKNDLLPSVLAFEKKLVPSAGFFYGFSFEDKSQLTPLRITEKTLRGTISNRLSEEVLKKDPLKINKEVEKPNIQTVDVCTLPENHDAFCLSFTLKVIPNLDKPSACNNPEFLKKYCEAINKYIEKFGFKTLAHRYAINLANARFLWRNRIGAEAICVEISINQSDKKLVFNSLEYSLNKFDSDNQDIKELATAIEEGLNGEKFILLTVNAFAKVGKGQEVYPSEEMVFDKGQGNKSKVLYSIEGIAGMHSQKIGNAIRSIDTWYPGFDEQQIAIAIETYGSVTHLGCAYRVPNDKKDFYTLFDKFIMDEELSEEEQHYVVAVLIRGGVFGQSNSK